IVCGHYDTTCWPEAQLTQPYTNHDNGVISGAGVFDMYSGLILNMLTVREMWMRGHANGIRMFFEPDEEQALRFTKRHIPRLFQGNKCLVVSSEGADNPN